uniref:RRM domain-containing protein n=1 Tax=Salix viminalis TaxID=40686 RepID=A0A6N2KV41_SALVM
MARPFFDGTLSRKRGNRSWNVRSATRDGGNGQSEVSLENISVLSDDAIRGLDNIPSGYDRHRLSVEWARGEHGRHRDGPRMTVNQRPTKTLFVINVNPIHLRVEDIKRHFECYGEVLDVRIRLNFAFVQFETQEDATKALHCLHMMLDFSLLDRMINILDRVVSVEYALRDDCERGGRYDSP